MSGQAFGALWRNELRLLKRDTAAVVLVLLMPLVVISILKSTMGASLVASGVADATGAEQVVPGIAVMFSFFLVGLTSFSFFREYGWSTWDRLRSSRASRFDILVAKALPWALVSLAQLTILFGFGVVVFGLNISSLSAFGGLAVLGLAWTWFVISFALAIVAVAPSVQLVQAVTNLGAIVFGALGGALVPSTALPGWAKVVAPFTPTHWAMNGFNAVLIDDEGLAGAVGPALILGVIALALGFFAHKRFDFAAPKTSFA